MNDVVEYRKLFIGGDWVTPTGTGTLDAISPHSEERVGRVPAATVEDVDRAVAAARAAFDTGPWPLTPLAERIGVVTRIKEGIAARAGDFAELISRQNGAPMSSAVRTQVLGAVAAYGSACTAATEFGWGQERRGVTGPMVVRHEPVGVVAAVVPWNVPQLVIAAKLAPALLAGCTVVLKPAPETPLDANLLAEVCTEAARSWSWRARQTPIPAIGACRFSMARSVSTWC